MSASSEPLRVLDASALISLLAIQTPLARAILVASGGRFAVTAEVAKEVLRDPRVPHQPVTLRLAELSSELITRVELGENLAERFVELAMSVDDGEASTLAYAEAMNAMGVIDDGRARSGLARVELEWSIDLLLNPRARERIGSQQLAEAVYDAGKLGRMRFPHQRQLEVIELIGAGRACECPGLQRALRR